jgi:hypothetical protein
MKEILSLMGVILIVKKRAAIAAARLGGLFLLDFDYLATLIVTAISAYVMRKTQLSAI